MPWSDEGCHCLILGWGTGVSDVRGAETDPVSATACGQVAAGIPKRGLRKCHWPGVAVGITVPSGPPMDRLQGLQRTPL